MEVLLITVALVVGIVFISYKFGKKDSEMKMLDEVVREVDKSRKARDSIRGRDSLDKLRDLYKDRK